MQISFLLLLPLPALTETHKKIYLFLIGQPCLVWNISKWISTEICICLCINLFMQFYAFFSVSHSRWKFLLLDYDFAQKKLIVELICRS